MFNALTFSTFFFVGICFIVLGRIVIRFNKVKNSCTREYNFVWGKCYYTKKLCNLNDIKKVEKDWPSIRLEGKHKAIFLLLKNGAEVQLFSHPSRSRNYDSDIQNINNFLFDANNTQDELILEENIYILVGIGLMVLSILGLLNIMK